MKKYNDYIWAWLAIASLAFSLILPSCANMGAPGGGPYDTTPPVFLSSNPVRCATNVPTNKQKIKLVFDENIQLGDQNKIIISPAQKEPPTLTVDGKVLYIEMPDSLEKNRTYSFYFDDALQDNNEGNPLNEFYYLFSTGKRVDSMRIAGHILDAETLEPVDQLTLGAYLNHKKWQDSIIMKKAFPFVSKTNKMGYFCIYGVPKSSFRIFAINDNDHSYKFEGGDEGIAWDGKIYTTSLKDSIRTDTIVRDSIVRGDTIHIDSTYTHPYVYYRPRSIIMRYFKEKDRRHGIFSNNRPDSMRLIVNFFQTLDTIPVLHLLDDTTHIDTGNIYIASINGKSATYWLKQKNMINRDSITFTIYHSVTDSLYRITNKIDTLKFFKPRANEDEGQNKAKQNKIKALKMRLRQSTGIYQNTPLDSILIEFGTPIKKLDNRFIKVQIKKDTLYKNVPFNIQRLKHSLLTYQIKTPLAFGQTYKVSIDSGVIKSIYGQVNKKDSLNITIASDSALCTLNLTIANVDSTAIAQLLDKSGNVIASKRVVNIQGKNIAEDFYKEKIKSTTNPLQEKKEELKLLEEQLKKEKQHQLSLNTHHNNRITLNDSILTLRKDSLAHIANTHKQDSIGYNMVDSAKKQLKKVHYGKVVFNDLKPDTYYMRLFVDSNHDNKWTTGYYPVRQPEMMYYCPEKFVLKKGFTDDEFWDVLALPLTQQKPLEIRTVKPEKKERRIDKNIEYYRKLNSN